MSPFPLCTRYGIDDDEIAQRHAFLAFSARDEENLQQIRNVLREDVDWVIDAFYEHLQQFAEVRTFLSEPGLLARLQQTQRQYLLTLGEHRDQRSYWENRLRIGQAHERVGLPQRWYLSAYARLFHLIRERLAMRHHGPDLADLLVSLNKIFTLDAILAVETYHRANVENLEQAFSDLSAAQAALEKASRTDALTGLNNRAFLMECLTRELDRSQRYHRPLSLLFIDLDHFKQVNDRLGHAAGDETLRRTAEVLAGEIRAGDILGRFGGEEFIVGLIEAGVQEAQETAERLRQSIERMDLHTRNGAVPLTVSIGVAAITDDADTLEQLLDHADQALYQAKAVGRNCVRVYDGPAPP